MGRKTDKLVNRAGTAMLTSARMNSLAFELWFRRIQEMAINMFEWKNLPETIDGRFLELTLFNQGFGVYFNDEAVGNLFCECLLNGDWDIYRTPKHRQAYATNGYYNNNLDESNSVIIWNNFTRTPDVDMARVYAMRLYELDRAIDVNIKGQKTPMLILCDEAQRLTMQNLYKQYDGNEPFIFGSKDLDLKGIQVFPTVSPFVTPDLQTQKTQIWNECLTFLGIENIGVSKKAQVGAQEVSSSLGAVEAQRFCRLNARRQAAEQINKLFGTNIEVEYRSDFARLAEEMLKDTEVGEDE